MINSKAVPGGRPSIKINVMTYISIKDRIGVCKVGCNFEKNRSKGRCPCLENSKTTLDPA